MLYVKESIGFTQENQNEVSKDMSVYKVIHIPNILSQRKALNLRGT